MNQQNAPNIYWEPSFDTLYDTYFQELASAAMTMRWQRIDLGISIIVAVTASGSTVAGWTLWNIPIFKIIWGSIAGFTSVIAIIHGGLGVTKRVKEQEELRRIFSELRVDLQTFRQQLNINFDVNVANNQYTELRRRYAQCLSRTSPDIAFTKGLRRRITEQVNEILREEIQS